PAGDPKFHTTVALWGVDRPTGAPSLPSHDYDLYLRCGEKPDASNLQTFEKFNTDPWTDGMSYWNTEYAHVDNESCEEDYWYVAINSYRGEGAFNLVWSSHPDNAHINLRMGM